MSLARQAIPCVACLLAEPAALHAQCTQDWLPQGLSTVSNSVTLLSTWGDAIVAGGGFSLAGGSPAYGLATWRDGLWQPLPWASQGFLSALGEYDGALIIAGQFTSAGSVPVTNIARYDGAQWFALGQGVNDRAYAVQEYAGDLIVGGAFTMAGAIPVSNIAMWDGVTWSPLGSGSINPVESLTVFQGDLIASGYFWKPVGALLTGIGRWDGTHWYAMNSTPAGFTDLLVHENELYFSLVGEFGLSAVSRWNGSEWVRFAPHSSDWAIYSLSSYGGNLIAGGWVSPSAPPGSSAIRRWDGAAWVPLGAGIPAPATVYAMAVHDRVLHVGGSFQTAGGLPSPYWARWGCARWPDCNNSGSLTIADFGCFQSQFVQQHPYADCNSDTALTIADFACFQAKFVAGCP